MRFGPLLAAVGRFLEGRGTRAVYRDRPVAARVGVRFAPRFAVRQVDVEQMDLVVAGRDLPVGIDQHGPVGELLARAQRQRADVDPDPMPARGLAQRREGRVALLGRGLLEQGGPVPLEDVGHLRRLDERGARLRGLAHEADRVVPVSGRVASGPHGHARRDERLGHGRGLPQAASMGSSSPRRSRP